MYYSISDLERLSGVQSHTIRMWEQRYNALVPHRSAGNTRYYDDEQLIRLLNIVTVSRQGFKISQICSLPNDAIRELIDKEIEQTASKNQLHEFYISRLLIYGVDYDEPAFSQLLSESIRRYGVKNAYAQIIYPLLVRLGLMWQKESVCAAQEHFVTSIIRQKIFSAIEGLPFPEKSDRAWMLFLPEEEEHEIGLLLSNYLLRESGQKVIYLGARVPMESLKQAVKANHVDRLLFFISQFKKTDEAQFYVDTLSETYPHIPIFMSGSQRLIAQLHLPRNMKWLKNLEELETIYKPSYVSW